VPRALALDANGGATERSDDYAQPSGRVRQIGH